MTIAVETGDITRRPVDGLITGVNSKGLWAGAEKRPDGSIGYRWLTENPASVDGAIQCAAGGQFHTQALALLERPEGETLVARSQQSHGGSFECVVFVVDDLEGPLYGVLMEALVAADHAGLGVVAVPALRTGVAESKAGNRLDKIRELVRAAHDFSQRARCLREIVFVVQRGAEDFQVELDRLSAPRLPQVRVRLGDITQVPSQGLVTAINSEGMWGGGVDRAIQAVAGGQFHRLAQVLLGKPDLSTLVALSQRPHAGAFANVVFVIDDLRLPLFDVLLAALRAADRAGLRAVTVPAMRMGVMMQLGGPPEQKIADMARAARVFQAEARTVTSLDFVIYGDPVTSQALQEELRKIPEPAGHS